LHNISFAQDPDEPPVRFEKKVEITLSNPLDIERKYEPVVVPLQLILEKIPDFNRRFFRLKYKSVSFEPLDIPSQIRMIPGAGVEADELVFQVEMAPGEEKIIELWYNPEGTGLIEYPLKTQSSDNWYRPAENIAWENELIAYRSYSGIVDFFAKTYPHLRLHDLPNDSYHHERLWGIDPYMVGRKPGIGGVLLFEGDKVTQCYGSIENVSRKFIHRTFDGGAVTTGGMVLVEDDSNVMLKNLYLLYANRYENNVHSWISEKQRGVLIAPGVQKFENAKVIVEEKEGLIIVWGIPLEEYGTIGTAIVWNPENASGMYEIDEGVFVKLKPSSDGSVNYLSLAVWNRASADQPASPEEFIKYVKTLAKCFQNPLNVIIH